jgi:hypothetical protein
MAATGQDRRLLVVILHYGQPELTRRLADQLADSDPGWTSSGLARPVAPDILGTPPADPAALSCLRKVSPPDASPLPGELRVLDNAAPHPFPGAWKRLDENLFWAGALAWCLGEAAREGFTHLWFLNNDCYFASAPPHLSRAWERLALLDDLLGPVGLYSPAALANPYHPQMVRQPGLQFSRAAVVDGIAPLFRLDGLSSLGGLDWEGNPRGYGVDVWNSLRIHSAGWPVVVDHAVYLRHVYHSTARKVDGFLDAAARAEADYLAARLGPDWKAELAALKARVEPFREFRKPG